MEPRRSPGPVEASGPQRGGGGFVTDRMGMGAQRVFRVDLLTFPG